MKTKVIRIYWRDWKALRRWIKGKRNETVSDYLSRVVEKVKEYEED